MTKTKYALLAAAALIATSVSVAYSQAPPAPPWSGAFTGATGQTNGGAINQQYFLANTDPTGFSESSLTSAMVVPATATAQAVGTTNPLGALIITKTTVITGCSSTTGVTLPSVQRYTSIIIANRSGGSCLIWPSIGATVETAFGTAGAINAPLTMLTNTDITFKPVVQAVPASGVPITTAWLQ